MLDKQSNVDSMDSREIKLQQRILKLHPELEEMIEQVGVEAVADMVFAIGYRPPHR